MSGDGKWKLHLPHDYRTLDSAGSGGYPGKYVQMKINTSLFDMEADPFETTNVIGQHPVSAARLIRLAEDHKARFYTD